MFLNNDFVISYLSYNVRPILSLKSFNKNLNSISDIVIFKKKSSLLKKNSDYNYSILNKINFNKNNFNSSYKKFIFNKSQNITIKNLDFSRKVKLIIKNNRSLFKTAFNINYNRIKPFNKFIKFLINLDIKSMFFNLEYNLENIILKSDFFFNKKDVIWFIKNGLISVNGFINKNESYVLKSFDKICIFYSSVYFDYYKKNLGFILNNSYKIKLKYWSITKNRFSSVNVKENYPLWIENYKFFKFDIPLFLEIDYISMSIVILNYNYNNKNFNYFNYKFISFYLSRLYNWKYIN